MISIKSRYFTIYTYHRIWEKIFDVYDVKIISKMSMEWLRKNDDSLNEHTTVLTIDRLSTDNITVPVLLSILLWNVYNYVGMLYCVIVSEDESRYSDVFIQSLRYCFLFNKINVIILQAINFFAIVHYERVTIIITFILILYKNNWQPPVLHDKPCV